MEKKNIDWANLGFGYQETDKRFVANYRDGAWDEGALTSEANLVINECAGVLQYAQTCFEGMKAYTNLQVVQPEDISRVHCEIAYSPGKDQFSIRDVSTYGVFYNGRRLEKGREYRFTPPARFMLASKACIIELGVKYEHH